MRVLRQLAIDEALKFPLASKILSQSVYMDDIIPDENQS